MDGPFRKGVRMSFVKTLAKVALGVALAKGASYVAKNGLPKRGSGGSTPRLGGSGDLLGQIGGMLGGKGGSSRALGGLIDSLGGSGAGPSNIPKTRARKAPSGFEALLASGGGLLGGALAGGAAAKGGTGGLGVLLDRALSGKTEDEAPTPAQELGAALMLRAMIQAIKADGQMDAAEKRRLMETLDGATRQELDFVNAELAAESDIEGLAAQVPVGMEAQVYAISLAAIDLDSRAEADYLAALARALGLTPAEVTEIHDTAGAPRLQV